MADTTTGTGGDSAEDSGSMSVGAAALKDTPLLGNVTSAVQDTEKGNIGSVASDVAGFVMGAQGFLEDPLNSLISAGLNFLIDVCEPVKKCLEEVTGDPESLDGCADKFNDVSKDIDNLAGELNQITQTGFQNWSGDAKDAATQKVATFVNGVQGTGNTAEDIAQLLQVSSMLMDGAKNLILGILSDLIEWLIVTWVAALAAEIPTLGASTAAAGAATTAEVGVEGAEAAEKVEQTTSLIERITNIIQKLVSKLKDIGNAIKDSEKALRDGEKVAQDGEKVASDGEKVASDGEKAAQDGEKAAQDGETTTEEAASAGDTPSGESPPSDGSGDGPSGDGSGGDGSGGDGSGGDGSGGDGKSSDSSSSDKKSWLQEQQENFNKNIRHPIQGLQEAAQERGNKSLSQYMFNKGDEDHSKFTGTLIDVGKDAAKGLAGSELNTLTSTDSDQVEAETSGAGGLGFDGSGINQELQG